MGRTAVPKGQVFLKKKEKFEAVKAIMRPGFSPEDFAAKFQEMYPDDWQKIITRYEAHERASKGKSHPMAEPWSYLLNIVKTFLKAKVEAAKKSTTK
jgi:hypothetical protein